MKIPEKLIHRAETGDLEAFALLDAMGIFCADDESATDFANRIRTLNQNMGKLEKDLAENGKAAVEDISVRRKDRIPEELFQEPAQITERLFAFHVDWVKGFFADSSLGIFFGGCAYYFYPDFFALFIIRRNFRKKKRWLVYQRSELLAHELCHVARVSLNARIYEEIFAYKTASTAFRRFFGGIFRSPTDSFSFLGATLLLLLNQLFKTFFAPEWPSWPAWTILGFVFIFLNCRLLRDMRRLRRAQDILKQCFPPQFVLPVLFRCSDEDILELAPLKSVHEARAWLQKKCAVSLRWQTICKRFLP